MSDWIKIDKLPEKQGEYLVFAKTDPRLSVETIPYLGVGCYAFSNKTAQRTNGKDFKDGFYISGVHAPDVTHWMPLPPEPKELKKDE